MDDVHPKMRFSLTPPPPKAIHSSTITNPAAASKATATPQWNSNCSSALKNEVSPYQQNHHNNNNNYNTNSSSSSNNCDKDTMQRQEDTTNSNKPIASQTEEEESTSDYKQWLHAMKLVARLPGGIPPEFRRKLWLSLADKYLKSKNVDWPKEEEKCFCEKWREDDEELGIQIVKDLHRTGSTLCTGPAGDVNQAKLKRILLGYARYNPEVGYCQGFNMLGALILQVMDKEEAESMKVMIYLVEGILPPGYFCGSMGGLQADMAVFRELMQTKLPRLARHLQKLQGPVENAFEPPLTNVFTMQWFLTLFCTCLPMSCVLRVWDLVLIEGSDVLLRTALALWSLLEERVLSTRSADDFYGKMGSFSSELLNGHLIDSNGLIEKVVQLGPIQDIQKLRDKHLYSVTPLKAKQGLNFYYDDEEPDMDEDSRLAVATVWGIPWGRRGSQGQSTVAKQAVESKDRIALDISLLKKQYDRLRERQKQAHIIITTACSTARQTAAANAVNASTIPVNQLLSGRPAIITNRGRRGPPIGAIPPARKPSLPAVLQDKPLEKQLRRGDTLVQWREPAIDLKRRRDSLTWKEIRAERAAMITSGSIDGIKSQKIRTKRLGKSDSSSYSEESEEDEHEKGASSSDTSRGDDNQPSRKFTSKSKAKTALMKQKRLGVDSVERQRPKSWAPSNSDIPFVLMTTDSPNNSADESASKASVPLVYDDLKKEDENSATECDHIQVAQVNGSSWEGAQYSPLAEDIPVPKHEPLLIQTDVNTAPTTSFITSHTTPPADVSEILAITKVLNPPVKTHLTESTNSLGSGDGINDEAKTFDVSDEGVTNQYFERVNSTERPTKLDLMYSLNEEDSIREAYKNDVEVQKVEPEMATTSEDIGSTDNPQRCMELLVDYSEKSSAACIAEAKTEISSTLQMNDYSNKTEPTTTLSRSSASKRRDPRRLTLTRSTTMEIEKRYQALEKRLSMEASSKYKVEANENVQDAVNSRTYHLDSHLIEEENLNRYRPGTDYSTEKRDDVIDVSHASGLSVQRKHVIPSTADLEERFENMIRDRSKQVSSVNDSENNKSSRKSPPTPKKSPASSINRNVDKQQKSPQGAKAESKTSGYQAKLSSRDPESDPNSDEAQDVEKEEDYDDENSEKQNASNTESKMDTTKTSLLRRKKEPPDEDIDARESRLQSQDSNDDAYEESEKVYVPGRSTEEEEEEEEEEERSITVSGNDSPVEDSEPEELNDEENIDDQISTTGRQSRMESLSRRESEIRSAHEESATASRRQSEMVTSSRRQSEMSTASRRMSEMLSASRRESYNMTKRRDLDSETENIDDSEHEQISERSEKSSLGAAAKKSPPSTEELEKRFDALEKQMSISKSEPQDEYIEMRTSIDIETDGRQSPDGFSEIDQQQIEDESQQSESETADAGLQDLSRSNRIKASVIEAMKSSGGHHTDDEDAGTRTTRMATNVMTAMRTSSSRRTDEEASENLQRSNKIKANVIEAMKSSAGHHSDDDEDSKSQRMATNVMEAMKSSSSRRAAEEAEKQRSNKMKASVIGAMKSTAAHQSDEEEDEESRSHKMASNVMAAMKSTSTRRAAEEAASEKTRKANKVKADIIEAMKSSAAHNSDDEDEETRSAKMASNVMEAMKSSSAKRSVVQKASEKQSRSNKIKAGILEAMKSPSSQPDEATIKSDQMASNVMAAMKSSTKHSSKESSESQSRSNRIKSGVLEAMKSSGSHTPEETTKSFSKSSKLATNVMTAIKPSTRHSPDEDTEVLRSNRIKANILESMKSSSGHTPEETSKSFSKSSKLATNVMTAIKPSTRHSPDEDTELLRSNRIKANILESMKSSSGHTPEETSKSFSKSSKLATNVMTAIKPSTRHSPDEDAEVRRSNRIKADILESMKSSSGRTPEETAKSFSKSSKLATNVMTAIKPSTRHSPDDDAEVRRSNKIKANILESMKSSSGHTPEESTKSFSKSSKLATNVMTAIKPSTRHSPSPDDDAEVRRSNRIKANILESMKSSSSQPSPMEDSETVNRSNKMASNVMEAMKASSVLVAESEEKLSRSKRIKADVIDAMKSSGSRTPEESLGKSSKMATNVMEAMKTRETRSNKIKADVIETMKSSGRHSPDQSKMANNVMQAMKSSRASSHATAEDKEKVAKSNRIRSDVIEAMKSSAHPSTDEDISSRSTKMTTSVMEAMKAPAARSKDKSSEKFSKSSKMVTNVVSALKTTAEDSAKTSRSNKIKSEVIEAMKSSSSHTSADERSSKMASNVMEAMKSSSSRRITEKKSPKSSTSPDESVRSNKDQTAIEKSVFSNKNDSRNNKAIESVKSSSSSGRRLSEPPTTEDLEKRYEVLKRRMSSRNFETTKGKRSTGEYSSDIEEATDDPTPKTSPPSTDSLERRFDKLQSDNEKSKSKTKKDPEMERQLHERDTHSGAPSPTQKEKYEEISQSEIKETVKIEKREIERSTTVIPAPIKKSPPQENGGRSALIEELQSKMSATPDGANIKPSSINPNRKLRKSKTDETSETHATTANSISGKYEPIHSSNRKMVRRFSDVPSRADLENRLQFLEEQLNQTLLKQRRASDSEVASTSRSFNIKPLPTNLHYAGKLESRVRELEKQLGASSKFSVERKEPEAAMSSSQMGLEITTDSIDLTGKELVRYNRFGIVDDHDLQNPINISINIHMTLNKDDLSTAVVQQLPRAEELSRRLLILEQQLKNSQRNIAASSTTTDSMFAVDQISTNVASNTRELDEGEDEIKPAEYEVHVGKQNVVEAEVSKETTQSSELLAAEKVLSKTEPEAHKSSSNLEATHEAISSESKLTSETDVELKSQKNTKATQEAISSESRLFSETDKELKSQENTEPLESTDKSISDSKQMAEPTKIAEESFDNQLRKQAKTPKDDDFDRRLQILEDHIKTMGTVERSMDTNRNARESREEFNNAKAASQSTPETAKPEAQIEPKVNALVAHAVQQTIEVREVEKVSSKGSSIMPKEEVSAIQNDARPEKVLTKEPTEAQSDLTTECMNTSQMVPVEVNKKTLVLLLDNEPKAVKVRRLTRANTEELEDLFQALEKQLLERGHIKPEDIKAVHDSGTTKEITDLTKEIMELSKKSKTSEIDYTTKTKTIRKEEDFDWGLDPVKHHLKKKTVYLPSTRELESRFRSLERQIKVLEDVEKIDVEQRLTEIERKIKLQYSLSHEKDLNRFLDLCDGKGLDDIPSVTETTPVERKTCSHSCSEHKQCSSAKKHQSPVRFVEPERMECSHSHSDYGRATAAKKHQSPVRSESHKSPVRSTSSVKPTTEDLEYRFRALDIRNPERSKSKGEPKREPIHPLEMMLDPSPDDIPTMGELEHRMKMYDEGRASPSPSSRKSRSKSPVTARESRSPLPRYESPSPSGLPTADELEARLAALEKEQRFDFKMQKNYKEFNQKLKDVISPSLSFEEFRATRSSSAESATKSVHRSPSPNVNVACTGDASTCPRTQRLRNDSESMVSTNNNVVQILEENSNIIQRILKKTIADSHGSCASASTIPPHLAGSVQEGLGVMGIRLMRETSPLRRTGTHTGVPLRTGENINDQLTSIKNTIKSIDSLCEEKPYRTDKCQAYIDSLFSDSQYFASKKSSLDDLTSRHHHSRSTSREYGGPSIRISEHSPAFIRSMGSADSIRSSSPLRPITPLQYHSNRDLRRDISPRRRRYDEEREENESRLGPSKKLGDPPQSG